MPTEFELPFIPHRRWEKATQANQQDASEAEIPADKEDTLEPRAVASQESTSETRIRANRENAKKSTGPKTPKGKRNSSRNAVKHGILSLEVVSGDEDYGSFSRLVNQLSDEYAPVGVRECILVQRIAVCLWRLRRALAYECRQVDAGRSFYSEGTLRYEGHVERALRQTAEELDRLQSERKAQEGEIREASPVQTEGSASKP